VKTLKITAYAAFWVKRSVSVKTIRCVLAKTQRIVFLQIYIFTAPPFSPFSNTQSQKHSQKLSNFFIKIQIQSQILSTSPDHPIIGMFLVFFFIFF
jgi:hypothetical protein